MTKLNDLEGLLLSSASRHDQRIIDPAPHAGVEPDRFAKAIKALVRKELAVAETVADLDPDAAEGATLTRHVVTDKGLAAIGVEADGEMQRSVAIPSAAPSPTPAPTRESKTASLISLLQRPVGATLDQMVSATGWLPHTTRAALSGLKKKGHAVTSEKVDGVRTYRIIAPAAA